MQADPRVLAGTQNLLKHHFCIPFADLQQELKMLAILSNTTFLQSPCFMTTLIVPHCNIYTLWLYVDNHRQLWRPHAYRITLQGSDPDSSAGCEETLLQIFTSWLNQRAMSRQAHTSLPKRPSLSALQHLLDDQLSQQAWETAALVALHYTVDCPEPALQGLTVALEGVRRNHCFDSSQELPTVCQGQYADGRPCTASAKQHGYCLRHQKQANAPPLVESVLSRLYEQVSQRLSQCFLMLFQKYSACSCCWRCC